MHAGSTRSRVGGGARLEGQDAAGVEHGVRAHGRAGAEQRAGDLRARPHARAVQQVAPAHAGAHADVAVAPYD